MTSQFTNFLTSKRETSCNKESRIASKRIYVQLHIHCGTLQVASNLNFVVVRNSNLCWKRSKVVIYIHITLNFNAWHKVHTSTQFQIVGNRCSYPYADTLGTCRYIQTHMVKNTSLNILLSKSRCVSHQHCDTCKK